MVLTALSINLISSVICKTEVLSGNTIPLPTSSEPFQPSLMHITKIFFRKIHSKTKFTLPPLTSKWLIHYAFFARSASENVLWTDHVRTPVRLSVRMFQLENYLTHTNEIWYGCCAIGDYLLAVLLNILRSVVIKRRVRKYVRWGK
jgi:hypothetical protein